MAETQDKRPRVLVVDDIAENTKLLTRMLEPKGFEVVCAHDGEEALSVVSEDLPDVILLDLVMPKMGGLEVCKILKDNPGTRHIPIMIITGMDEKATNLEAFRLGADDFILKPFDSIILEARIRSAITSKRLHDQLIESRSILRRHNESLKQSVSDHLSRLERAQQVTIFSMARLAESRDTETGEHLERMRLYAREVACEIVRHPKYKDVVPAGMPAQIFRSSPLHDIGKVGIPDQILLKPGKLSEEEFDIMKTHATIGGETLRAADIEAGGDSFLAMGRDIAYFHHEKWDGSGYPHGMAGEEIPLPARIVAVADVYDALTSKRPYKKAFSHEKSIEIIQEGRGSHFDPDILDAFLASEENIVKIREEYQDDGHLTPMQQVAKQLEEMAQST